MDRRAFLGSLGLVAAPLVAEGQQSPRLGVLLPGSPSGLTPSLDALIRRLAELGWVEGRGLVVERRWGEGAARLSRLAAELVALNTTVIVAPGPGATAAAKAATRSIPIVMIGSADPVAAGFVASLARPGGNLTGVSAAPPEVVSGKRLELLKQALPALQKVAVLWDTSAGSLRNVPVEVVESDGRRLAVRIQHLTVRAESEFENAFRAARAGGAGGVLLIETPLMTANAVRMAELGVKYRLPLMAMFPTFVTRGALMSYGPDIVALFRQAAAYVDKILRGAAPADLPVERPTTLSLAVNLKTAKALGLTIPPALLQRADQVIE